MPSGGCTPGSPANAVLPWARGEVLARLGAASSNASHLLAFPGAAPWSAHLSRPLRHCAILVDRHVHKNGGSTVRDLFLENERHGHALYVGYEPQRWKDDYRALRLAAEAALRRGEPPSSHVLLVENHFGRPELSESLLPDLQELSDLLARAHAPAGEACPLVLMTRLRGAARPLEHTLRSSTLPAPSEHPPSTLRAPSQHPPRTLRAPSEHPPRGPNVPPRRCLPPGCLLIAC